MSTEAAGPLQHPAQLRGVCQVEAECLRGRRQDPRCAPPRGQTRCAGATGDPQRDESENRGMGSLRSPGHVLGPSFDHPTAPGIHAELHGSLPTPAVHRYAGGDEVLAQVQVFEDAAADTAVAAGAEVVVPPAENARAEATGRRKPFLKDRERIDCRHHDNVEQRGERFHEAARTVPGLDGHDPFQSSPLPQQPLAGRGLQAGIRVQEKEQRGPGLPGADPARPRLSEPPARAPAGSDHAAAGVPGYPYRAVPRPVVHDNDFPGADGLTLEGLEQRGKPLFLVAGRNDHAVPVEPRASETLSRGTGAATVCRRARGSQGANAPEHQEARHQEQRQLDRLPRRHAHHGLPSWTLRPRALRPRAPRPRALRLREPRP